MSRVRFRALLPALLLVLVLGGVGLLAGAVSAVLRGPTFTSEAQLIWDPSVRAGIDPAYNPPDSTAFDRQVADQQDVVLSDAVVGRVARAIDEPADRVRDDVTVSSTAGSAAFTIAASATSATEARSMARATTAAYLAILQARNERLIQARADALTTQVAALRRQLATANTVTGGPLATSLADLQTQLTASTAALQDVPIEATVERAAAVPTSPSSLSVPVQTIVGGALGAVLAIVVLLLVNALRTGQRSDPRDVPGPARAAVSAQTPGTRAVGSTGGAEVGRRSPPRLAAAAAVAPETAAQIAPTVPSGTHQEPVGVEVPPVGHDSSRDVEPAGEDRSVGGSGPSDDLLPEEDGARDDGHHGAADQEVRDDRGDEPREARQSRDIAYFD